MRENTSLYALLDTCTVKLTVPGRTGWGTGFFVAPNHILTCEHVVRNGDIKNIQVCWGTISEFARATVKYQSRTFDIALLTFESYQPLKESHPCVLFGTDPGPRDKLYLFGYSVDEPDGCPRTPDNLGLTGGYPPWIQFEKGQILDGMSGAPLLHEYTGKICGMVKYTRGRRTDIGGGAVPVSVLLDQLPKDLLKYQENFHRYDRRWRQLLLEHTSHLPPLRVPPLKLNKNWVDFLFNYVFVFLFLIGSLILWTIAGLFAKAEFPTSFLGELLRKCIKGPEGFYRAIDSQQEKITERQLSDFRAEYNSRATYIRLSEYEAKITILGTVIKKLYGNDLNINAEDKISLRAVKEKLSERREAIWVDLEPLREKYDPYLRRIEDLFNSIYASKVLAEEDYNKIQNFLDQLTTKYGSQSVSTEKALRLLREIHHVVIENPGSIRRSRLKSLKSTYELMLWMFSLSKDKEDIRNFKNIDPFCTVDITDKEPVNEYKISWLNRICFYIDVVFSEILEENEKQEQSFFKKYPLGLEKEWIESINFYGIEERGNTQNISLLSRVKLSINIGWDRINKSKKFPPVKGEEEAFLKKAKEFKEFIFRNNLSIEKIIVLTPHVREDVYRQEEAMRELYLNDAPPIQAENLRHGVYIEFDPEIPSFQCELNFEDPQ